LSRTISLSLRKAGNGLIVEFSAGTPGVRGDEFVAHSPSELRKVAAEETDKRLADIIDQMDQGPS